MRTIAIVTSSRADYGICHPVLRRLREAADLRLSLFACGMHLAPEFGLTVRDIEADGFAIDERVDMLMASDSPTGIAKSIGVGVIGFADVFARRRPDILVLVGDRFEMFAAAAAALPYGIPMAHVHGGEATEGAIDEAIRHSLTKMSHLHFVSTERYRERVVQLGEEPWRVTVSGAPALDNLRDVAHVAPAELAAVIGMPLDPPPLLVTFHPVTLEHGRAGEYMDELLGALDVLRVPVLFTYPNADAEGRAIIEAIDAYVLGHSNARSVASLGTRNYFSLMRLASVMVGNSSSGIVEAASFGLPVVNIGNRQRGRLHGENVLDVPCTRDAIVDAVRQAATPGFRGRVAQMANPYGNGTAAECIVGVLRAVALDDRLLMKRFHDLPVRSAGAR